MTPRAYFLVYLCNNGELYRIAIKINLNEWPDDFRQNPMEYKQAVGRKIHLVDGVVVDIQSIDDYQEVVA